MNEPKLVEVYTAYGEMQAQIIRGKLESAGIRSIFQNEALGTLGFVVNGLGQFHVMVNEQDEQAAREVLEETESDEQDPSS